MSLNFAKTKKGKMIFAFFIVMMFFAVMLPVTTYALNANGFGKLKNVTNPDVFGRVKIATWYKDLGRAGMWKLLVGLSGIVDLFESAVDTITGLNLYTFIQDQFDINSVVYPIVTAVASVAVVFVAVLLIYNADKTRLTDFARGIITSLILIMALPAMVSALSELRTKGVDYVKESTGDVAEANSEGVYYRETLGQKTLSRYTYLIWESIQANTRISVRGPKSTWNPFGSSENSSVSVYYSPATLYSTDINAVLPHETLECYVDSYETSPVEVQNSYSELTYEIRRELCGVNALYNDWMEMRDGKEVGHDAKISFSPTITLPNGMQIRNTADSYYRWLFTSEAPEWHVSYEYYICTRAADYVYDYLLQYGIGLDTSDIYQIRSLLTNSYSLSTGLKKLDSFYIELDDREMSVMAFLNMKNNEEVLNQNAEEIVDGYYIKKVVTDEDFEDMGDFESLGQRLKTLNNPIEHVYKYDFDFFWAALELFILAIALFFAALKLAGLLYDILFAQIIVPIIVASDMNSSGKAKAAIQNLINTFLIFIIVNLLLRLYILVLGGIQDSSTIGNNFLVKIILILAGAKFVIDGPDLVTKILGIDAGVKSGMATVMGVRTAVQMGSNAVRTAKNVGGKAAGAVGGAASGMVSGGASGFSTSRSTGQGYVGSTINALGGAVGGAFAGGVSGATGRGNALQRGSHAGQTAGRIAGTPIGGSGGGSSSSQHHTDNHEHSGNGNSSESNNGGEITNNSSSGSSGGSEASGANNESGVSNSTSHVSTNSSAPTMGGAFIGGGSNAVPIKGDKGDKGDRGNDGLQGIQGNRGEVGEKGKDAENNAHNDNQANTSASTPSGDSTVTSSGSAFSGTWADQQRSAENNSASWAQETRAAESSAPTYAEQQLRSEQSSAPAPSTFSAPEHHATVSQHSQPAPQAPVSGGQTANHTVQQSAPVNHQPAPQAPVSGGQTANHTVQQSAPVNHQPAQQAPANNTSDNPVSPAKTEPRNNKK
ncbi:MAG: hypothetical protein IJ571_00580 [Ruminococcus sp.]|nr:hypothetical protein [Ruminococcus sp.]